MRCVLLGLFLCACTDTQPEKAMPFPNADEIEENVPSGDSDSSDGEEGEEQEDSDSPEGEEELPYQDGTAEDPILITLENSCVSYEDSRDTTEALSDIIDIYPPFDQDESGPEYFYTFTLTERSSILARLAFPEPSGVDNDIHLLGTISADSVIARDHYQLSEVLEAGTYYLVVDSYGGEEQSGPFDLHVDIASYQAGTMDDPISLARCSGDSMELPLLFTDSRDTSWSDSSEIDSYPPDETNESGPEFIYHFSVDQEVRLSAEIVAPEPDDVDVDLHLLDSLNSTGLIARGNASLHAVLAPGEYWISMDTYVSGGQPLSGEYTLTVQIRSNEIHPEDYFNDYLLDAVDLLYANYSLLGYDSAVLTHDIEYGEHGTIERSGGNKTMCVAAMLEVLLTAMEIYETDTGDGTIWDFLPQRSFEYLGSHDLKAHLWVNHELDTWGSADALRHFGMGENIPFTDLLPGSFINLNRTTGTGHAVLFIAFIDKEGIEYDTWNSDVIGFLYFSSQGGYSEGNGGLDYRYAIFSEYGSPEMPYKRDTNVIYREDDQRYLNTGMAFHPDLWQKTIYSEQSTTSMRSVDRQVSFFDADYFDGVTIDD